MQSQSTRRNFLKSSAAVCAGSYFVSGLSPQLGWAADFQSPNEQPGVGFIGTGIRYHTYHGKQAMKFGPCIAVCDVDSLQLGRAQQVAIDQHREQRRPLVIDAVADYRRVLDHPDVDVVVIGTVDHWHTKIVIEAMKAGKDVYCEKPVTLTIREGQQILKAQQETGKVIQVGTQQRTEFDQRFAQAVAMMRDNRVGDLQRTTVAIGGSRECESLPVCDPPPTLDWNLWLGQCPVVPYRSASEVVDQTGWGAGFPFSRAHRYYRWFYEYSGGKLTDWGAHHVDIAMWALDKMGDDIGAISIDPVDFAHPVEFDENGMPKQDDRFNCATKFNVQVKFADGTEMMIRDSADDLGFENGIMFEGNDGRFLVNRGKIVGRPVEQLAESPLPADALKKLYPYDPLTTEGFGQDGFHMKDFMECVKSRRQTSSDMLSHHRMLNVCHGVNVALRLGRKVVFDPKTETFSDDKANSFVEREQRKGFETDV